MISLTRPSLRNTATVLVATALLVATFCAMVLWLRGDLRREIHQKIVERDAAVLYPVALRQVDERDASRAGPESAAASSSLTALLQSARQQGMLAIAVFDRDGSTLQAVPSNQLFVELPIDDFWRLQSGRPLTRYHPRFPLDQYFAGIAADQREAPVLEVLLPLPDAHSDAVRGFVRYYIDARPLSRELAAVDRRINRQTALTLLVGALLLTGLTLGAAFGWQRAQRVIADHHERLARANFELTLAAKASAIGQITSHLIHDLQNSVQGLRSVVAEQSSPEWQAAADYADRLQRMVHETIALLADAKAPTAYDLTAAELADLVREHNRRIADERGVILNVVGPAAIRVDSHRGSLLRLIANNLVQNAVQATARAGHVCASFQQVGERLLLTVTDQGPGIPDHVRAHLFTPGRSGRPGGSGLGLAISQLLARQMGSGIVLHATGPHGTTFTVEVSLSAGRPEGALPPPHASGSKLAS